MPKFTIVGVVYENVERAQTLVKDCTTSVTNAISGLAQEGQPDRVTLLMEALGKLIETQSLLQEWRDGDEDGGLDTEDETADEDG